MSVYVCLSVCQKFWFWDEFLAKTRLKTLGQPTDFKKDRIWLKLCTLVPWPNTWGAFFVFQKFWFFGPGDEFWKKWRETSQPNFRQIGQFGERVRLEKKSPVCTQSKFLLPNTKYFKFYNWASNNLKILKLSPGRCVRSTINIPHA